VFLCSCVHVFLCSCVLVFFFFFFFIFFSLFLPQSFPILPLFLLLYFVYISHFLFVFFFFDFVCVFVHCLIKYLSLSMILFLTSRRIRYRFDISIRLGFSSNIMHFLLIHVRRHATLLMKRAKRWTEYVVGLKYGLNT
jgi:hypothetical protein